MAYDNFKLIRKLSPIVNIINQLTCRCVDRFKKKKEKNQSQSQHRHPKHTKSVYREKNP